MLNVYFDNQTMGRDFVGLLLPLLLLPLNGSFPVPLSSFRQAPFHSVPLGPSQNGGTSAPATSAVRGRYLTPGPRSLQGASFWIDFSAQAETTS